MRQSEYGLPWEDSYSFRGIPPLDSRRFHLLAYLRRLGRTARRGIAPLLYRLGATAMLDVADRAALIFDESKSFDVAADCSSSAIGSQPSKEASHPQ